MKLFLIRHAIAEERSHWNDIGKSDALRPLTQDGIRKFRKCLNGFKKMIPSGTPIYSSEFERSKQTAMLLGGALPSTVLEVPALNHGTEIEKMYAWLKELSDESNVVLIGHEPELSLLIDFIFDKPFFGTFHFKKGGMVIIRDVFENPNLEAIMRPKQIRLID